MWSPRSDLTIRSSVASGFRPPAVFDEDLHITLVGGGDAQVVFADPDLVEESSIGYLLSTEWRPTFARKGSATVAVNLFRTELEDLFLNVENDDPSTPEIEFLKTNQGDAMVEGVEISASLRWGPRISADFGFVQQTSRFGEPEPDFGSRDFFRSPDRYGSAGIIWRMTPKTDLFSGVIYTGSMKVPHYAGFIEEDRLETTGSFVTLDVNVTRHLPILRRPRLRGLGRHQERDRRVPARPRPGTRPRLRLRLRPPLPSLAGPRHEARPLAHGHPGRPSRTDRARRCRDSGDRRTSALRRRRLLAPAVDPAAGGHRRRLVDRGGPGRPRGSGRLLGHVVPTVPRRAAAPEAGLGVAPRGRDS